MNRPIITTLIPTFNRADLLKRAIRSALAQTYTHIRVRVFDNASTDYTASVVEELQTLDPRVEYHRHATNIGGSPNFDFAMASVDTAFFSVLSDDDVLLPTFYEVALRGFDECPEAVFSACSVLEISASGEPLHMPFAHWPRMGVFRPLEGIQMMVAGHHPTITGIMFRTEASSQVPGLDPELTISDVDLEIRLAARFPFVVSSSPGALFIPHSASASALVSATEMFRQFSRVIDKLKADSGVDDQVKHAGLAALDRYLRRYFLGLGVRVAVQGDTARAETIAGMLDASFRSSIAAAAIRTLARGSRVPALSAVLRRAYERARRVSPRHRRARGVKTEPTWAPYLENLQISQPEAGRGP